MSRTPALAAALAAVPVEAMHANAVITGLGIQANQMTRLSTQGMAKP